MMSKEDKTLNDFLMALDNCLKYTKVCEVEATPVEYYPSYEEDREVRVYGYRIRGLVQDELFDRAFGFYLLRKENSKKVFIMDHAVPRPVEITKENLILYFKNKEKWGIAV